QNSSQTARDIGCRLDAAERHRESTTVWRSDWIVSGNLRRTIVDGLVVRVSPANSGSANLVANRWLERPGFPGPRSAAKRRGESIDAARRSASGRELTARLSD